MVAMGGTLKGRDVISINDFSREEIDHILKVSDGIEKDLDSKFGLLSGKILSILFFEPSTRTRMSFESAMYELGGRCIDMGPTELTSVKKGETFSDTIKVISKYADVMVLRHPSDGAARYASEISDVPIINGGDGTGQHPTQTLLDLYTIKKESKLDGANIGILGDLKYGRTVHSLVYALSMYGIDMTFISPPDLSLPEEIKEDLDDKKISYEECDKIEEVIEDLDVLYVTRIQRERFPDILEYEKVSGSYKITKDILEGRVKEDLIILHPLPRTGEIDPDVDDTKYARYFLQTKYGVVVRMAILGLILGGFE